MRPILWLASYPKSGNTWMRVLLANLGRNDPVDINAIQTSGGIASARARFDNTFLIASGLLTHDECDALRSALYRYCADLDDDEGPGPEVLRPFRWLKTHDAWTLASSGEPVLGGAAVAKGAVLIVRDPRDVVASLASHNQASLDRSIAFMNAPDAAFADATTRQPQQMRQRLLDWSGFYRSWIEQDEVPVLLVRYEDMLADPAAQLGRVLNFAGIALDLTSIARAAELSAFEVVRQQEEANGFLERPRAANGERFFRGGRAGGWRDELSAAQRALVEEKHAQMMRQLGYLPGGAGA